MNTLTDLRRTLDQHAGDVAAADVTRASAVHHRVAAVRRRRRAVGTGALALVLVAGAAATVLPRLGSDAAPAAPTLLGQKAPTTVGALGFTYRTDGHGESFTGSGSIHVEKSNSPQLFTWTTSAVPDVRVVLPDHTVWHSVRTRFHDYVVVPAGSSGSLRLSVSRGRVAVASYDLTDALPAGATSAHGITFRDEVAGTSLLTGVVGERGQTVLRSSYVAARGGALSIAYACSGGSDEYWFNIALNHQGAFSSTGLRCDGSGSWDAGTDVTSGFSAVGKPGSRVSVRVWLSKDSQGKPVPSSEVPGLHFGVGIYGPQAQVHVGGTTVPRYLEYDGHLWAYSGGATKHSGRDLRLPASGHDRLAEVGFHTHQRTSIYFDAGGTPAGSATQSSGGGAMGDLWVRAGSQPHVHLRKGGGSYGIALYQRLD
ncbi:MAG: hypothetical protein QM747_06310 [Nocardioides sp.]